jgi:ClpX C4-type zinc finger
MPGRDDSGRCSFCARGEAEVGRLFSRGEGSICAPCVEIAVDALDREVRTLERQVERHRRLSDLLLTFALLNPAGVPAHLVDALEKVVASSRALETAVRRWVGGHEGATETDPQARFAHVAAKLVGVLRPLRAWRASLPPGVPGGQLYAIDEAITALATLAKVLDDPSPEGSGRRR